MSVRESSSAQRYVALIVCADDRSKTLAARLNEKFKVYVIKSNSVNLYTSDRLEPIGMASLPTKFDVLFFHTGRNDPDRIPADRDAQLEFAFSGGDEPYTTRTKAYKIFPPFVGEQCPVDSSAVKQIVDLLEGKRTEPPTICTKPRTDSPLAALAVLCQGYLAVNAESRLDLSGPERQAVDQALERMGWNIASEDPSLKNLLKNLSIHRRKVNSVSWWVQPFVSNWGSRITPSGLDIETFVADLKDEWKSIGGDLSKFGAIRELTAAFTAETGPDGVGLSLSKVAAAYSALADTVLVD